MTNFNFNEQDNLKVFSKKSLVFSLIFVTVLGLGILYRNVFDILLIIFAGLLLGTLFVAFARKIQKWTKGKMKYIFAAGISIIFNLIVVAGLLFLIGHTLKPEIKDLVNRIPEIQEKFAGAINDNDLAGWVKDNTDLLDESEGGMEASKYASKFFSTTFGVFGDIYAILFVAIFVAVSPKEYYKGAVALMPNSWKSKGSDVLFQVYKNLKIWLKTQLLDMLIMFILTALVLGLMGLDYWLILAILTALFCFIPNIGPMISIIPMVAVGLLQSPEMAFWVFIAFMGVQLLETGFIGPYIRKKMLSLPPALVLVLQLIFGVVGGVVGILVATPILVVLMVLVKKIYLKKEFDN